MTQAAPTRGQILFGPFVADLRTRGLFRNGIRIKVPDRPFDILAMLLEHPGELVTREEMRKRLWPDGTFVDFDNNISSAVGKLRAALGDSAAEPRYIETLGHGYRLMATVRFGASPASPVPNAVTIATESNAQPASTSPPRGLGRRTWLLVTVLGCVVAIAAGITFFRRQHSGTSQSVQKRVMLAVLPFENLTGDRREDYFSDGMTEEMITQLGRLDAQHLGVIARTSVMRYKDSRTPLPQIGSELGVQYVLEGSVRREGDHVRVTAQLINVQDQTHLWAREYEREMKELLAVQTEIAQEIAGEIQPALGNSQPKYFAAQPAMSPQELDAYDLYLKGQYFMAKRTAQDFQKAINFFQQAIAKHPNDARSWAALSDCYALIGGYSGVAESEFASKARTAAIRALEIDESLPEAHTALALIVQNYDWDWQTAEREYRRAIELDPNYVTAHHWYAEHLMWRGRFDQALQESEKARQLDPLSLIVASDNAVIYYYSRQYDLAIRQLGSVLQLDPNFSRAMMIRYAYVEKGRFPEALESVARTPPENPWHWSDLAYVEGRAGHMAEARQALRKLESMSRDKEVDPEVFVRPYLALGSKEKAVALLQKAYAEHSNIMTTLNVDPAFDPLRADPRFKDLVRRVRLSQ